MSYEKVDSITISKDFKTFKTFGGCNNVVPRHRGWTLDIPMERLFENFSSGNFQMSDSTEKKAIINATVQEFKDSFGGSFDGRDDFYFLSKITVYTSSYSVHEVLKVYRQKQKDNLEGGKPSPWVDSQVKELTNFYENYESIISRVDNHINAFLKELKKRLHITKKTNRNIIIKGAGSIFADNVERYVYKVNPTSIEITTLRANAKRFTTYMAKAILLKYAGYTSEEV